jgi:glyoxylase-like metal-dependent hydrolase (beta-lactamase superfamily II)
MKVTIVYDNCPARPGLKTGWGFSCLIEVSGEAPLLFDTGADGATLLYNMACLHIDPQGIGIIVLSHAHGDHTGGLAGILEKNKRAEIYVPASVVARLPGRKVTSLGKPTPIRWRSGRSGASWLSPAAPTPGSALSLRWLQATASSTGLWAGSTASATLRGCAASR